MFSNKKRKMNLIEYLPPFMQGYKQLKEIFGSENPEIENIFSETSQFLENQFIMSTNEEGIRHFEKMLGIRPYTDDSLESRIHRVFLRWTDFRPYTYKMLIKKLDGLCGEGNYRLIPDFDNYYLEVVVSLSEKGMMEELVNLLDYMMPANMDYLSRNVLNFESESKVNVGSTAVLAPRKYVLSTGVKDDTEMSADLFCAGTVSDTNFYTLKTGVNETYSFSIPVKAGYGGQIRREYMIGTGEEDSGYIIITEKN